MPKKTKKQYCIDVCVTALMYMCLYGCMCQYVDACVMVCMYVLLCVCMCGCMNTCEATHRWLPQAVLREATHRCDVLKGAREGTDN